jgi:hypothetical protein
MVLLPKEYCTGRMTLQLGFKVPCILSSLSHLLDGNSHLVLKRKKKKEKKLKSFVFFKIWKNPLFSPF